MSSLRRPAHLEAALVALVALNGLWFAFQGSASKAVDSASWLALLILFLAETKAPAVLTRPGRRFWVRAARLVAAAGVIAAAVAYIVEGNRLDAINSALWIGVVLLIEAELRFPAVVCRARLAFSSAAFVLYGGLATLVFVWLFYAAWIDAYDAALWLVAFATLEVDVMRRD